MGSPCMNCMERKMLCHSACPQYAEFRRKIDDLNRKRQIQREKESFHREEKKSLLAYLARR